jgi:hypothetical protein
MDVKDRTPEIDAMLDRIENEEKAKLATYVTEALNKLNSKVVELRALGIEVSLSIEAPSPRPYDKIEKVGSTKEVGWYAYVDFLDEEGTKRRIDAAKKAVAYANGVA